MNHHLTRILIRCALVVPMVAAGCNDRPPKKTTATLDWMEGEWEGTRRAADDGSVDSMFVLVIPLPGGPGNVERLRVGSGGSAYIGFAVRSPSDTEGRWSMLYANSSRDRISRLEGEVGPGRATWQSAVTNRPRISEVVMESVNPDRWRRTNRVSVDSGKTWSLLFTDELERTRGEGR